MALETQQTASNGKTHPELVLASSSPYRRQLLGKLGLPFSWASPGTNETALPNEPPGALVKRLAEAKAQALEADYPQALIIGSDQVAVLTEADAEGKARPVSIFTKPLNHEKAKQQLQAASGQRLRFLTSLCLYNTQTLESQVEVIPFDVVFRELSDAQIERYLEKEQPFDCAGSFKSEGLGISLFEKLEGDDPNALIGLPLIALTTMLQREGLDPLST